MTSQQRLVKKVLKKALFYQKGKKGPSKGITKPQLATLLDVTPVAINNWLQGYNGIAPTNFTFLKQLEKLIDANGSPLPHKVLGRKVARRVLQHGISKYKPAKYMFLTTGQKHWTNAHAVTV